MKKVPQELEKLVIISFKYVCHLVQAYIVLLMGLFEVLIMNMMLICGANKINIYIT